MRCLEYEEIEGFTLAVLFNCSTSQPSNIYLSLRTVFSTSGLKYEFWSFLHHYYAKLLKSVVKEQQFTSRCLFRPQGGVLDMPLYRHSRSRRETYKILRGFYNTRSYFCLMLCDQQKRKGYCMKKHIP